jgi:UDP-3-O-[3-hydroxymyristoyl] glucosamine N-acyltransferase
MLYKHPGQHEIHGSNFAYIIVDESDIEQAIKDGWFLTTDEAKASFSEVLDSVDATKEEMIQKAESLGIKVDKRWSVETLLDKINQALKGE